jgi:hypothetical protein
VFADPRSCAVCSVGLPPHACWDCGFESRRAHGCLSLMSVMCCQVEVSASGWSLVQRSPTACGVSECCHKASTTRPRPTRGCCAIGKRILCCRWTCEFKWSQCVPVTCWLELTSSLQIRGFGHSFTDLVSMDKFLGAYF